MLQQRQAFLDPRPAGDPLWDRLCREAQAAAAAEPPLATLIHAAVLDQDDFETAATQRAVSRIAHAELPAVLLRPVLSSA